MYHFGINIYFKSKNVIRLNIIFYRFYKIILIKVIFIYSFTHYLIFVYVDQLIFFFAFITHESR